MKKAFLIFTVFNILLCSMPAYGQWSDSELRTLEGSYKFTFVVNNPDNVISRLKSSQFYDGSDSLLEEILHEEIILDVKEKDGQFLLFDRGIEIANTGVVKARQLFLFQFELKREPMAAKGFMYKVLSARLLFNKETKEYDNFDFEDPEKGSLYLLYYYANGEEQTFGNGYCFIERLGREPVQVEEQPVEIRAEEKKEEPGLRATDPDNIPRGITFVKGTVQVKRAGTDKWIKASKNMGLNPGDMVRTGKNSYAELGCQVSEFAPAAGSDIRMGPLSVITVPDETLKVESNSRVRVAVDDAIRNVYALFGKEEFEVETPTAVTSIRGTDFIIDVDEDGNTEIILKDGQLTVRARYDNSSINLSSGQKVTAAQGMSLSPATEMTSAEADAFDSLADVPADKNTLRLLAIPVALLVLLHLFRKRKKK